MSTINREQAIETIQKNGVGSDDFVKDEYTPEKAKEYVINLLKGLSEATTERKTGKWIRGTNHGLGVYNYTCSECKHTNVTTTPDDFCGKCGSENKIVEK